MATFANVTVDIIDFDYQPGSVTIQAGDTVTWTQSGEEPHTVTADDGSFDSGNIEAGESFAMVFDAPGFYTYSCLPHKTLGMLGVLIVDDPNAVVEEVAPSPVLAPRSPDDYTPDH